MEAELTAYLQELRTENAETAALLRAVQARDEKEKADILAAERTLTSWWERHRPGEALPVEIASSHLSAGSSTTPQNPGADPSDRVKQSLASAFAQMPNRFTTKDFFPLVPEIQSEEVPDSQGYDFLRRQIEEERLWIYQQGAGRRATTYSKERVTALRREVNEVIARGNGVDTSSTMEGVTHAHAIDLNAA